MNRRDAITKVGLAGLSATVASIAASASSAEPGAPTQGRTVDPTLPPRPGSHPKHDMRGYGIPLVRQRVAMLVYPGMTALDLIGPHQILSKMGNVDIDFVWKTVDPVLTDGDFTLKPTLSFADCPDNLTVLFVPGGLTGAAAMMTDAAVLEFLVRKARTAKYVASVCTGSLILGAAGLLRGYKATSHWMTRDLLAALGARSVKARVVVDRNRVTGAGVTACLDFALQLVTLLRNEKMAKALQLANEYDPQPLFRSGKPETAPAAVTQMEWAMNNPSRDEILDAVTQVRKRRKS